MTIHWNCCIGILFLSCLSLILCSCEEDFQESHPELKEHVEFQVPHQLPLLKQGQHVGYIEGFNPDNPPQIKMALSQSFKEAKHRGMDVARIQIDWADLEPEKGKYEKDDLVRELRNYSKEGLAIALLISTADSSELTYPADLVNNDRSDFQKGRESDDPYIISRFIKLMDWVLPLAKEHGVYMISIGNEPDTRHEDDPDFMKAFINFVNEIRAYAHSMDPDIAITFTANQSFLLNADVQDLKAMMLAVDALAFNFYCYGNSSGFDQKLTSQYFQKMVKLAGQKPIHLQEVGCSSEYILDPSFQFHKSSPQVQQSFYKWFFSEMKKHPQLRSAYIFQLVENSPTIDNIYQADFNGSGLSQEWVNSYVKMTKGLGLIDFDTAETKPAWQEFINGLDLLNK